MNTTHQSELNYTTTNEHRALSQEMSPGKSLLTPDQGVFLKKKNNSVLSCNPTCIGHMLIHLFCKSAHGINT